MNQFFYESRGKEKLEDFRDEGIRNQAYHKSGASKLDLLRGLPKLIIGLLSILGLLGLLIH
jgi:hypothetical protein